MVNGLVAEKILLTERGEQWLSNFEDKDKAPARELVASLTLVSALEFERKLVAKIEEVAEATAGLVALYAVRELVFGEDIFPDDGGEVSATPRGSDIGSEGRVATIIRNLVRERSDKFVNHPTICQLRDSKIPNIFFVDDFIGSGKRVTDYINNFYSSPTIKSWSSYQKLKFCVVAYSGTGGGRSRIGRHKVRPKVIFERSCPSIGTTEWKSKGQAAALEKLCKRYAKKQKMRCPLGFGKVGALMVFEHSCPNNCPQILWGDGSSWKPLFVGKSISSEVKQFFPPEIVRNDPVSALVAAGESRIAKSGRDVIARPLPHEWIIVLSLVSRSIRKIDALENATNMNHAAASKVIEDCISHGLITPRLRLTDRGAQELKATRKIALTAGKKLPKEGEEYYYPQSLRSRN